MSNSDWFSAIVMATYTPSCISDTPGWVTSAFSSVSEPTPLMVTMFSKPELLVTVVPRTSPFRPDRFVMLSRSSAPAVMAAGVFCRLVVRLSERAVTVSTPSPGPVASGFDAGITPPDLVLPALAGSA